MPAILTEEDPLLFRDGKPRRSSRASSFTWNAVGAGVLGLGAVVAVAGLSRNSAAATPSGSAALGNVFGDFANKIGETLHLTHHPPPPPPVSTCGLERVGEFLNSHAITGPMLSDWVGAGDISTVETVLKSHGVQDVPQFEHDCEVQSMNDVFTAHAIKNVS